MNTRMRPLLMLFAVATLFGAGCRLLGGGQEGDAAATSTPVPVVTVEEVTAVAPGTAAPEATAEPGDGEAASEPPGGDGSEADEPAGGETVDEESAPSPIAVAPGEPSPLPAIVYVDPPAGPGITPGSNVQHRVQEGEWLLQIARCYGASYSAVRQANAQVYNPNWIMPGTTVTVPNAGSDGAIVGPPCVRQMTAVAGDTWNSLAQEHGTTSVVLQRINPGPLLAGRAIYVPASAQLGPGTGVTPPYDVLFNFDGDLAVWQAADGRVAVYPDDMADIIDLETNQTGRYVLTVQTRDGGNSYEVALADREANVITVLDAGLLPTGGGGEEGPLLVSPDGAWVAYALADGDGARLTTASTSNPAQRNLFRSDAWGPDWAPWLFPDDDPDHLLLADRTGVSRIDYALQAGPESIIAVSGEDPSQPVVLIPHAWSPAGRFLMVLGGFIEGGAYFILDSESGRLQQLAESSGYIDVATASWQPDGYTVVVMSPPDPEMVDPNLIPVGVQALDNDFSLIGGPEYRMITGRGVASSEPGYVLSAPAVQTRDSGANVVAIQGRTEGEHGLWQTVPDQASSDAIPLTRLNNMPANAGRVVWAPNGTGLLANVFGGPDSAGDVVYVGADGSGPFSLIDWLGFQIGDFHWLTP